MLRIPCFVRRGNIDGAVSEGKAAFYDNGYNTIEPCLGNPHPLMLHGNLTAIRPRASVYASAFA